MRRPYRLTTAFIRGLKAPGCYGDGRGGSGLQIRVHQVACGDVSKNWRQKLHVGGKPTTVGLGSWPFVTLTDARKLAAENRLKVLAGVDPRTDAAVSVVHPVAAAPVPVPVPTSPSFDDAARSTLRLHRDGWKEGSTTEARWLRSLAGLPFGAKPMGEVTPADVLGVVGADWTAKPSAAKARLAAFRAVFRWSIGAGHRTDDPTEVVAAALPKQNGRTKHHEAVPVADVANAVETLRTCKRSRQLTRLCIEFQVLTAVRPGEATGATWSEINGDLWTIPADRMKVGDEHRVPLTTEALAVLRAAARETGKRRGLVFPSKTGKVIGGSSLKATRRVCGINATAHGFRSTFRDWCAETGVAREVAESCLAHVVGGVEGAYFRSDLLERRREVMERWAAHLA